MVSQQQIKQSPFAPSSYPKLPKVDGVKLFTGACEIKYKDKLDVLFAIFDKGSSAAGVFTTSKTRSGAVDWSKNTLKKGTARGLLINSGNSNAFTGKLGQQAVEKCAEEAAKLVGSNPKDIFIASTGVIGVPLPYKKITSQLPDITKAGESDYLDAAKAISTTDTFYKLSTRSFKLGKEVIVINGIAKGSGMIAPDMATMISCVFTNAKISNSALQKMLNELNDLSFNSITVDSDTSTSDSLYVVATNKVEIKSKLKAFKSALYEVLLELAQLVVKDGEGASKFIEVEVTGAESHTAARRIAKSVGNSPLVKTAIAGEDANWGRVVAAVGKSGECAERDKLKIHFGNHLVAIKGAVSPTYSEEKVSKYMKNRDLKISVDVGVGKGHATIWTCDLTHGYISINADYRS